MIFQETQRFRQIWLWLIMAGVAVAVAVPMVYGFISQIILKKPFGNHPTSDTALILFSVLAILQVSAGIFFLRIIRLDTLIDETGISYKFFPFDSKFRRHKWEEIEKAEVVTYNPVKEYGGWGLRFGKKGRAFNISGNKGLEIKLKTGKIILLGTNKEEELKNFLLSLGR